MIEFSLKNLSGWGNYPVQECRVFQPEQLQDIREAIACGKQKDYIARGLGRSYGDASVNGGSGVIVQTQCKGVLSFDHESGVLECEAGLSLADVIEQFLPQGFFFPVTPGTKYVTVGGAIAGNVHGKNHHHDGTIAAFLLDFRLLTGTGEVLTCSREENPVAFWATVGGMGLTGIIVSARLRLHPVETAYITVDYQKSPDLDTTLEQFNIGDNDYKYSVAWIDLLASGKSLGRSVLIRGNHTPVADLPKTLAKNPTQIKKKRKITVPTFMPNFLVNPYTISAFNTAYYAAHPTRVHVITDYDTFFYPLDSVLHWNRMYGRRGFIEYQAAFPTETSRQGQIALMEKVTRSRRSSFLAVLKSFGPADEGYISFPSPGHTLALHMPHTGSDFLPFLRELDAIVLKHGGRINLTKDAVTSPETFAAMYPNLPRFQEAKAQLDPQQRFASSQAKRLKIVGDH